MNAPLFRLERCDFTHRSFLLPRCVACEIAIGSKIIISLSPYSVSSRKSEPISSADLGRDNARTRHLNFRDCDQFGITVSVFQMTEGHFYFKFPPLNIKYCFLVGLLV